MQSSELESGLPDEAEQDCIVFFLLGGCSELNSNSPYISSKHSSSTSVFTSASIVFFPVRKSPSNLWYTLIKEPTRIEEIMVPSRTPRNVPKSMKEESCYLIHDIPQARKRLCTPAQLRRASPTPIRWIA